ncbi:MAG: helix-turn-helix transcriptional regulator [Cyanobacteriota bacterium]
MAKKLTAEHLRYGSVSLLAKLIGVEISQVSAWFNSDRQITSQNLSRIANALGVSVLEAESAIGARRSDRRKLKIINQEILEKIKEAQT